MTGIEAQPMWNTAATGAERRGVYSPGGYEMWRLHLADGDLRAVFAIGEGDPWSADLRRKHLRYRRSPTRHAPPKPGDFAFARAAVVVGDSMVFSDVGLESQPAALLITDGQLLSVGSAFWRGGDGVELHYEGPSLDGTSAFAELRIAFASGAPRPTSQWRPPACHYWTPLCMDAIATGVVRVRSPGGLVERPVSGFAAVEHLFGAEPIAWGMERVSLRSQWDGKRFDLRCAAADAMGQLKRASTEAATATKEMGFSKASPSDGGQTVDSAWIASGIGRGRRVAKGLVADWRIRSAQNAGAPGVELIAEF